MHRYRTHNLWPLVCLMLLRLFGLYWLGYRVRDHAACCLIDLPGSINGLTKCCDSQIPSSLFKWLRVCALNIGIRIDGAVKARDAGHQSKHKS